MFQKGNKLAGSRKGIPNKSKYLKERVLESASKKDLEELARKFPNIYWNLVGKCIDKSIELGQDDGKDPVTFLIRGYDERTKVSEH